MLNANRLLWRRGAVMSRPNSAECGGYPILWVCGQTGTAAARECAARIQSRLLGVKSNVSFCWVQKGFVKRHPVSRARKACCLVLPFSEVLCLFFCCTCSPPSHSPSFALSLPSLTLQKSNLVCRVVAKATSVRLIDDTRKGWGIQILKAGEKEQAVLAARRQDKARRRLRDSAGGNLPQKIPATWSRSEQNSRVNSEKFVALWHSWKAEDIQERKKGRRSNTDQHAKHFFMTNSGQMAVKFILHCGMKTPQLQQASTYTQGGLICGTLSTLIHTGHSEWATSSLHENVISDTGGSAYSFFFLSLSCSHHWCLVPNVCCCKSDAKMSGFIINTQWLLFISA